MSGIGFRLIIESEPSQPLRYKIRYFLRGHFGEPFEGDGEEGMKFVVGQFAFSEARLHLMSEIAKAEAAVTSAVAKGMSPYGVEIEFVLDPVDGFIIVAIGMDVDNDLLFQHISELEDYLQETFGLNASAPTTSRPSGI